MDTVVVGITGPAHVGKSTLAGFLTTANIARRPRSIPMARALKRLAMRLGWNGEKDEAGRKLLQNLGQTLREYDPDYWIRRWEEQFTIVSPPADLVIVDDVRHQNEYEYLRDAHKAIFIDVQTDRELPKVRDHISERGFTDYEPSISISNSGSPDDMRAFAESLKFPEKP